MKKQHGYTEFLALIILLSMSVIVVAYIELAHNQLATLKIFENSFQAKYNAESGVDDYLSRLIEQGIVVDLNNPTTYLVCSDDPTGRQIVGTLNTGQYRTCLTELSRTTTLIDTNGDGIKETTKVTSRKIKLTSYGEYKTLKSKSTVTVQLTDNSGSISYNVLEWMQDK